VGIEQQPLAVRRRLRVGSGELIERAVVELGRDLDQAGHTVDKRPSR
jgi:hypothetical protein